MDSQRHLRYPELNVKVNCVPAAYNLDEVTAIAGLAKDDPLTVRFIELMPIGQGRNKDGISEEKILGAAGAEVWCSLPL